MIITGLYQILFHFITSMAVKNANNYSISSLWAYKIMFDLILAPVQQRGLEATFFATAQVFWCHADPLESRCTVDPSVSMQQKQRAGIKRADYGKKKM